MRSLRDERGHDERSHDERSHDERGLDEPADDLRRAPAAGGRSFADREVPIVPEGEPS